MWLPAYLFIVYSIYAAYISVLTAGAAKSQHSPSSREQVSAFKSLPAENRLTKLPTNSQVSGLWLCSLSEILIIVSVSWFIL